MENYVIYNYGANYMPLRKLPIPNVFQGTGVELSKGWAVVQYDVDSGDGRPPVIMWIGAVALHNVFNFAPLVNNSEWHKLYHPDRHVIVFVHATGDKISCMNEANRKLLSMTTFPHCNLRGYNTMNTRLPIKCSNGITYATQSEAAKMLGLNQGSISAHLRGKLANVDGYVFTRTELTGSGQ